MHRKAINFAEQIKNSQNFLHKLQGIKKASKDIKQKNKLTLHRNLWFKEYTYLCRLQRDANTQIDNMLENIDQYLQYQYEERGVFKGQDWNGFKQMKDQLGNGEAVLEHRLMGQVQNLPLLLTRVREGDGVEIGEVGRLVRDVGRLLEGSEEELARMMEEVEEGEGVEADDGMDDDVQHLRPIAGMVQGFDMGRQQLQRVNQGEQKLREYLSNYNQHLTWDQISEVIQEYNRARDLLDQTYQLQLQKIGLDYQEVLSFTHPLIKNPQTYQQFTHLYHTYIGRGKSLIHYFERLSIHFPKTSKANLQGINNHIVGRVFKERKIKAAKRNYLREKEQLLQKVEKEVNLRIEKKIKDAQKEAEQLLRKEEKIKLEKELQALRAQYKERQEVKQKEKEAIEEQHKQEERKKQALRRVYLQDLGRRAEEAKEVKQTQMKQTQQAVKQKAAKEEQEKKKKVQQNQPKVRERQSIERRRLEMKIEARQVRQKQNQVKEQRINKAIESYPFRPQVQASEDRLNAPTEAMIKRKQTKLDKADKVQLTKVNGYSADQLMGDMRFRLNAALNEAGLANTDYARQVLKGMSGKG